jgi:hypothetical protein
LVSFIIVKVPQLEGDRKKLVGKVDTLSIHKNSETYRKGIKPETLTVVDDGTYFEFGFEYDIEFPTVEGVSSVKTYRPVKIILLRSNFLAIEALRAEELDIVKRFLESNFTPEVVIEPIPFDDQTLMSVIDNSQDVFEIDHSPFGKGMETVDHLKYSGRGGITHSLVYEEHGDEPLERVKVKLKEIPQQIRVTFNKKGTVTVIQRSEPKELIPIIRVIVDRVILPYASKTSYQRRLL